MYLRYYLRNSLFSRIIPVAASNKCKMLHTIRTFAKVISPIIPKVVFVLGPPGSGKGTQCVKIVKQFDYVHFSAGELLRKEIKSGSKYGKQIDTYIKEGKILPVEITCSLLEKNMIESGKERFLIDGFPRNEDNLNGWNKTVASKVNLQFVLFFDLQLEVAEKRILGRGAAGSGRTDDNLESLYKRFKTYENQTIPVIEYYKKHGLLRCVDATKSPDEVFKDVEKLFLAVKC